MMRDVGELYSASRPKLRWTDAHIEHSIEFHPILLQSLTIRSGRVLVG